MAKLKAVPAKKEKSSTVVDLFSMLLQSVTQTHIQHLQTKSYATHVALQGFYEGIPGLFDALVETYQGKYGIVEGYKTYPLTNQTPVDYLTDFHSKLEECQGLFTDTDLKNIFDEIKALTKQTLYKLQHLS